MQITCSKRLPYSFQNFGSRRMTNLEKFEREATEEEIEELKRNGYKVTRHPSKKGV